MKRPTPEQIEAKIVALLEARDAGKTICPSDAARALAGAADFRPLMESVRARAREMAARGELEITQGGRKVDPGSARGAIRLGRPTAGGHPGLGAVEFSPHDESWLEYGPPGDRRRIDFHDYGAIYAVPGLYERVFYETLMMRSTAEVVRLYAEALTELDRDPGGERVIDFGAGNGLGGEFLRELGVGAVIGIDLEPMAQTAAERDRPGTYDEYHVGDLGSWSADTLDQLRATRPTALLALSAVGVGHVPRAVLERALGLLGPGGIYAFAVAPPLAPESTDPAGVATGYPAFIRELIETTHVMRRAEYVHRSRADGSDDLGIAFVGVLPQAA